MKNFDILKIYEISELLNEGYMIARLESNRKFDAKALKAKKKSLKSKGQLQPAVVTYAQTASNEKLAVIDFVTGEPVAESEMSKYLVLVEGNHRYKAHLELKESDKDYNGKFYVMLPLTDELHVADMLAEMNVCTNVWKGTDYIRGAIMSHPENATDVLRYMAELESRGFSLPAISKYVTTTEKVTKNILQKFMNGDVPEVLSDSVENAQSIARCKKFLDAANAFDTKFLAGRCFADWLITKTSVTDQSLTGVQVTELLVGFLSNISKEQADEISSLKGKKGESTKEDVVYSKLNDLYRLYREKLSAQQ